MAWRTITFDADGGTLNSQTPLYYNQTNLVYLWATQPSTAPAYKITGITPPTRAGLYVFGGFFDGRNGAGMQYVTASGAFVPGLPDPGADITLYAWWDDLKYVISLDSGKYGSGGTGSFYQKAADSAFYSHQDPDTPITSIMPPTGGGRFDGYWYGGAMMIDAQGNFTAALLGTTFSAGATFTAAWPDGAIDYFVLSGALLACVQGDDGVERGVVETSHTGTLAIQSADSAVAAHKVHGRILNPVNVYRVIGCGTVTLVIGKAYGKATVGAPVTEGGAQHRQIDESGYMLTGFKYATAADGVPELTVYGTGNEGYTAGGTATGSTPTLTDAVNTWTVNLDVCPDHVAQDPFGAVSGGGELVRCVTAGTCQPVVPREYGMPCASDVTHGKITVDATVAAYGGEAAPTAVSPFVETRPGETREDCDFAVRSLAAERSL